MLFCERLRSRQRAASGGGAIAADDGVEGPETGATGSISAPNNVLSRRRAGSRVALAFCDSGQETTISLPSNC
jgi:hypothetical protein